MTAIVNNSLETNDFENYPRLKLFINICTLLNAIFAIIVSLLIISYIGIHFLQKKTLKVSKNISLLLTCNTCWAIICSSSTLTLMMLSTIGGDLDILILKQITRWHCHTRGYLHFVFINSIYLSYVLQASFRLCRIAFHESKCLRTIYSFLFYTITQWITSFLLILPVLIAREDHSSLIVYLRHEFYCQVPMTSIRGIVFSILSVYFVPVCCICIIYLWIIIHLRHTNTKFVRMIRSVHRKRKRDTIIIKRICIVMIVLLSLGIPSCLFVIVFVITGHLHWTCYRIGWMTISISFALISLSSIYVTPQIYKPIRVKFTHSKPNQKARSISSSTNINIEMQRKSENYLSKQNVTISIV
jgi:hypothetical protein